MYQNYTYYPPVQQPMGQQVVPNYTQPNYLRTAQSQNGLKGRLVSSLEEKQYVEKKINLLASKISSMK